jgi:hypothetical protein
MNRIKTLAIVLFAILTVGTAQAQSIVKQDATMNEYIKLLNHAKHNVLAFDISSMKNNKCGFTPLLMKYEDGKTENLLQNLEDEGFFFTNDVSRFTIGTKLINDTTWQCHIHFGDESKSYLLPFKKVHGKAPFPLPRPFVLPKKLKMNEFIPLMAISSGYYDERSKIVRSCDVYEFKQKNYLNTITFQMSPLIYVIGVKCKEL